MSKIKKNQSIHMNSKTGYCIYLDGESKELSYEHIIPLSLGGLNGFGITCDKKFNNEVGYKIDGKLANDFVVLMEREKADARGYSNNKPLPLVKNVKLNNGEPAQAIFSKIKGLQIYDVKEKKFLENTDSRGPKIKASINIHMDSRYKFVSKVALSASYFAYGDIFKKYVQHEEFRKVLNFDGTNYPTDSDILGYDPFTEFKEIDKEKMIIIKKLCEIAGCSCVLIIPSSTRFSVAVGVLGMFVGYLSVPSESQHLPNEGLYRWGHCIYLHNNEIKKISYMELLHKVANKSINGFFA